MKTSTTTLLACSLMLSMTGCLKYEKSANSHTSGTTTMMCDNTFENIMEQEIDVFEYQYPEAHILTRYVTQREAIDSLLSFNTKTIVIPRDLTKNEKDYIKSTNHVVRSTKIAVDAIALIVNPANPVYKLTKKEISQILSGETRNWNDIEPNDLGEISIVFDDKASSLATYMRDSLLNGADFGPNVYAQGSIPNVFQAVKDNKNAIGVLGVTWITSDMSSADLSPEQLTEQVLRTDTVVGATLNENVKVLSIYNEEEARAYKPYQQHIFNGTYPLYRQMYMITTGPSGSLASGFYAFVTGDIGQKIIMKTGILPARATRIQVVELK